MTQRWQAHHYGKNHDNWGVRENVGGGWEGEPPTIVSWLTERQAVVIAEFLNDVCGVNWHERHPDWWAEIAEQRAEEHEQARQWMMHNWKQS